MDALESRLGGWVIATRWPIIALQPDGPPRSLAASVVLHGLTPDDVCEAIEPVRFSRTVTERMQAVARIVRRRREASVRVREPDPPPYTVSG